MVMQFVGGVILDWLGLTPGFRIILAWSTVASVIILIIRARGLRETLDMKPEFRDRGFDLNLSNLPQGIIGLIVVGGVSSFAARMAMPFMVVYAVEVIGLSKSQWGLISMITGMLSILLGTFGGFLSDRIARARRKSCLLVSRIVEPLSKLGFINARGFGQVFAVRSFNSLGSAIGGGLIMKGLMMGGPVWQALVADIVPPSERGRIIGLMRSAQILLGLPSSWFGGYLWENYAPELTFKVSGVIGFIVPIILYILV